jgi:hypothetical protein
MLIHSCLFHITKYNQNYLAGVISKIKSKTKYTCPQHQTRETDLGAPIRKGISTEA